MVIIFKALCGSVLNHVELIKKKEWEAMVFLLFFLQVNVPPIRLPVNKVNSFLVLSMWECHLMIPWKQEFLTDTFHTLATYGEYDLLLPSCFRWWIKTITFLKWLKTWTFIWKTPRLPTNSVCESNLFQNEWQIISRSRGPLNLQPFSHAMVVLNPSLPARSILEQIEQIAPSYRELHGKQGVISLWPGSNNNI